MLRTSSYTIYVDLPDSRDEMLIVHGYTGAYDRVSRRVANYLRSREARRPPKPLYGEWSKEPDLPDNISTPDSDTLKKLAARGYLTELEPKREEEFFARLADKMHQRSQRGMPSYIFMPTYDCNLRCAYCFQDHMRTDSSFKHLLKTMSFDMADSLIAAMPSIEADHGVTVDADTRRNVGFFGGEPLLAANRPVVEHIMSGVRELGPVSFWAVSNATELRAYDGLLGPEGIVQIQVTLDGPTDEHDRRRHYADGSGSFERIADSVDFALAAGTAINVRLNLDRDNINSLPALAADMLRRGWPRHPLFSVYTAPIHAVNDNTDKRRTFDSWQLDSALSDLRLRHPETELIGRPDETLRTRARRIFDRSDLIPAFRPSFCGAHDRMYIFDALGDVYACWERTGDARIRIANVLPGGEVRYRHEIQKEWRSRSVTTNPVCRQCRYALHCGGGCAILALGQRGTMHANYCDGYASRFRASAAEAYMKFRDGEEVDLAPERVCDL